MQTHTALARLEKLPNLAVAGKPANGLYRLLTFRPLWEEGLARIRTNKGAVTPGVDGSTVLNLGQSDIETAIQQLMDGTYRPQPVRRVYIPKANGKLRPLGIPTALDRLVQEVVRSILHRIYEPIFYDRSHGFRVGRSCHTALDYIYSVWSGVKWFVEVDIKGYFDNIDHSVLIDLLRKRIADEKFLALISAMLKAGFLEDWVYNQTHSGTPQGGIISPLLANIYLHELDLMVENYIRSFDQGKERAVPPAYRRLTNRVAHYRRRIEDLRDDGREDEALNVLALHDDCMAQLRRMPAKDPMDPAYKRLRYVRYADDFLFGVIGSKDDARAIMEAVVTFLSTTLKLEVSPEKSGIRKANKGVLFLGYQVVAYTPNQRLIKVRRSTGRTSLKRSSSARIMFSVPRAKVQAFAKRHGYGHYDELRSIHRPVLLHCDDIEIVTIYNSELRGFANYYVLAQNVKRELSKLRWLWQTSLFKTLANKHRTSVNEVARRFRVRPGTYVVWLQVGNKRVERKVWTLKDLERPSKTSREIDHPVNLEGLYLSRTSMAARLAADTCSACGSTTGPFHIHHVNPMRTRRATHSVMAYRSSTRVRKTMTLCTDCHDLLHTGRLPDLRVRSLEMESRVQ